MAKYSNLTLGKIEALVNKIGIKNVDKVLRGELVLKAVELVFAVWKTVKLATVKKDNLFKNFEDMRYLVDDYACEMLMNRVEFAEVEQEVDLVITTAEQMGFHGEDTTYGAICRRAKSLGLQLCPTELGFQLRLQYADQKYWERLLIVSEPVADARGNKRIFCVQRTGDSPLLARRSLVTLLYNKEFGLKESLVFVKPRK